jgi:hypothetical protein
VKYPGLFFLSIFLLSKIFIAFREKAERIKLWKHGEIGNKNTPSKALAELAKDEDRDIRKAAKSNPNYKNAELESYLTDQNTYGNDCGAVPEAAKDEQDKGNKEQNSGSIDEEERS